MSYISIACQAVASLLLIGAAVQDIRSRTISNAWPAALLVMFIVAYSLGALSGPLLSHLLHFLLALSIGMVLFALGWFGGGDAKLYAAIALWFTLGTSLYLFISVAMAGLILALIHLVVRLFQSPENRRHGLLEGKLAYGVAIAVGAIVALPQVIL